jgi:hypothetical protein
MLAPEITNMAVGALVNLLVALIIVRGIYYPVTREKNFVFLFLAFNIVIYFVLGLLTSASLSVGVGFGLFAIFSVLRYRTSEMPIREMTYLFVLIALPVMNSVLIVDQEFAELAVANGIIIITLFVLEREWGFRFESSKQMAYERIDLIRPDLHEQLLADVRERTGLPVKRFRIDRLDFVRDIVEMTVFYDEPKARSKKVAPSTPTATATPQHSLDM